MTPKDIATGALRVIHAIDPADTPDPSEVNQALDAMWMMLESWYADSIMVFASVKENFTLANGTAAYTIGPSGTFNTPRPTKINGSYIRVNDHDYPVRIIQEQQYRRINEKSTSDRPKWLYYHPAWPLGTIFLYCTPDQNYDLHIWSEKPLAEVGKTADVNFEGVYNRAVKFNLAVDLAPEYEKPVPVNVAALAKSSKTAIISLNAARQVTPAIIAGPCPVPGKYNIDADNYGTG